MSEVKLSDLVAAMTQAIQEASKATAQEILNALGIDPEDDSDYEKWKNYKERHEAEGKTKEDKPEDKAKEDRGIASNRPSKENKSWFFGK